MNAVQLGADGLGVQERGHDLRAALGYVAPPDAEDAVHGVRFEFVRDVGGEAEGDGGREGADVQCVPGESAADGAGAIGDAEGRGLRLASVRNIGF